MIRSWQEFLDLSHFYMAICPHEIVVSKAPREFSDLMSPSEAAKQLSLPLGGIHQHSWHFHH